MASCVAFLLSLFLYLSSDMTLCYYLQNLISAFVKEHKHKMCQYDVSMYLSLYLCVRLLEFIIKNSVPKPIRRLTIFGNDQ